MVALQIARELHRLEGNPKQLARDDGLLALVRTDRNEFAEALRLLDECIRMTQGEDDSPLQHYCRLNAAKTLIRVGYWAAAAREIAAAEQLARDDIQRGDREYQSANLAQEQGDHVTASVRFKNALHFRRLSQRVPLIIETELNLAYSLAEQKQIDQAQHHLQEATLLDSDHKKEPERTWVAAQIAYRADDLSRASLLVEQYFKQRSSGGSVDRDDQIDAAALGAQVELKRGDLEGAARWARRGVEQAEFVRGAQSALVLRSWVLAKRRAPYELLFAALARDHQVDAAAMVFDQWQGRTVQDALATPRPPPGLDYDGMIDRVTRLGDWLRVVTKAGFARDADQNAVLRTMRDIDLLALIVADRDVWRLTANHGPLRLSRVGRLDEIKGQLDEFRGHPTEGELASQLGTLLLPDDIFRETRDVLHVIVDGQLGGVPVAALRHGDTALIAIRPVVRLLRLPEITCAPPTPPGHATVLAAPGNNLLNALEEGARVARLLRAKCQMGAAATKAALFAAGSASVLHVASHGANGSDGGALVLADGKVSALEILASRRAPSLAVLSACDTATSDDTELAGSLAAGFLGAGAQRVVATLRPVSDAGALDITTRFYEAGGVADPARALQRVQAELAKTNNTDWPNFAVFGPDVCRDGTR